MASLQHIPTSLQTKTWLVYVQRQSALYCRVSLNIIREVCDYFHSLYLLPVCSADTLRLYDLETKSSVTFSLQRSFTHGTVFCFYQERRLLCVGNHRPSVDAWSFDVAAGVLAPLQSMEFARAWSGVVKLHSAVYVFGGNTDPSLKSCEAMDVRKQQWRRLPDMHSPKVAFTPTVYGKVIFLGCLMRDDCPFEAFNTMSEVFRIVPISLTACFYGCVSFVVDNTLKVITYDQKRVTLRLDNYEKAAESIHLKERNSAISNTPIVIYQKQAWWVNYISGEVVCYDLETNSFT